MRRKEEGGGNHFECICTTDRQTDGHTDGYTRTHKRTHTLRINSKSFSSAALAPSATGDGDASRAPAALVGAAATTKARDNCGGEDEENEEGGGGGGCDA